MTVRIKVEMNLFSSNNDKSMVILFLFFPFSFTLSRIAIQVGLFEDRRKIKITQICIIQKMLIYSKLKLKFTTQML